MFLIACRHAARVHFSEEELRVVNQVLTERLFKSLDNRLEHVCSEARDWKAAYWWFTDDRWDARAWNCPTMSLRLSLKVLASLTTLHVRHAFRHHRNGKLSSLILAASKIYFWGIFVCNGGVSEWYECQLSFRSRKCVNSRNFYSFQAYKKLLLTTKQTSSEWKLKDFKMKKFLLMSFTFSDLLKLSDSVNDVAMTREFLYRQHQALCSLDPPAPTNSKSKVYWKEKFV